MDFCLLIFWPVPISENQKILPSLKGTRPKNWKAKIENPFLALRVSYSPAKISVNAIFRELIPESALFSELSGFHLTTFWSLPIFGDSKSGPSLIGTTPQNHLNSGTFLFNC